MTAKGVRATVVAIAVAGALLAVPATAQRKVEYITFKPLPEEVVEEVAETSKKAVFEPSVEFYEETETETHESTVAEVAETEEHSSECESGEGAGQSLPEARLVRKVKVNGSELDEQVLNILCTTLEGHGISWWLPYAVCTMYHESRFDTRAENTNGLDKGILQYRNTFWCGECAEHGIGDADIFDPVAQILIYCEQTARRLASGCSVEETINRHNQSDWGGWNQEYVEAVLSWLPLYEEVWE